MSLNEVLKTVDLAPDAVATLIHTDGADVFHYTDDYIDDALLETTTAETLAGLLATSGVTVATTHGTADILQDMRDDGLLDEYGYDFTFQEYLAEVLRTTHYDYDWLETNTERYDYKRGRCDVKATVKVAVSQIVDHPSVVNGWKVNIPTKNGTLSVEW